jgi:C1A family cysteine protease
MSCARSVKNLESRPQTCPDKLPLAAQQQPKETKYFVAGASLVRTPIPMSSSQSAALSAQQPPPPKTFDWREQKNMKNQFLVNRINQGGCGSCWAIATATAMGDRYAIALNKRGFPLRKAIIASPIELLSCSCEGRFGLASNQICLGGNVQMAANYLQSNLKVSTNACFPYPQKLMANADPTTVQVSWESDKLGNGDLGCMKDVTGCQQGKDCKESSIKMSVVPGSVAIWPRTNGIDVLKREIVRNGPVVTSFAVPPDFIEWWKTAGKNDVYTGEFSSPPSGHAVVIVGYTKDAWIIQNSWGPTHDGSWYCLISFDNNIGVGLNGTNKEFPGGSVSFDVVIDDEIVNAFKENKYIGEGGVITDDDNDGNGGKGGLSSGPLWLVRLKLFWENLKLSLKPKPPPSPPAPPPPAPSGNKRGPIVAPTATTMTGSTSEDDDLYKGKAFASTANFVISLLILAALITMTWVLFGKCNKKKKE